MNAPQLRLDTVHRHKDGTCTVRIKIPGVDLYLGTGVYLRPEDWNEDVQMCMKPTVDGRRANNMLRTMLSTITARLYELELSGELRGLTRAQLRELLLDTDKTADEVRAGTEARGCKNVARMFERVIATKTGTTARLYRNTLKHLGAFRDLARVSFDDITPLWLKEFEQFLAGNGMRPNSISIEMRNLRAVVNVAIDEGATSVYGFRRYKIPREDTEKRWLPLDQMRQFIALDGLDAYCTLYRDMFVLIFLLIGINIVDLSELKPEDYRDGRIHYRRNKTGRLFSIKVEPEAAEIIERYRGTVRLLAPFERFSTYNTFAQKINDGLRRIGPLTPRPAQDRRRGRATMVMQPINTEVTMYWARHSWATYAAMLDVPRDTISEALGHAYGCAVTGVYIDFDRRKVDAANRRVIDWVLYGKM